MTIIQWALFFVWGREQKGNRGPFVRMCLAICGINPEGSPWCAAFVSLVLYLYTRGNPPFKSDGTKEMLDACVKLGWERDHPVAPGLCFPLDADGNTEHVTIIVDVPRADLFATVGGNEGNPALKPTSEGFGVFPRERVPTPGKFRYVSLEAA